MRVVLAACGFVSIALLAIAAAPLRAASAQDVGAPKTLRAAAFEAAPAAVGKGRFRLAAQLQPARAAAAGEATGARKLVATLAPKGLPGACALPDAIFSDGFESP